MNVLDFASATELSARIRAGDVSATQVVQAYLDRIDAINPLINAVTVLAPDALDRARQADEKQARGEELDPLHGVPFTVKDTFATRGLTSDMDRRIRGGRRIAKDATVVERMYKAGAILVAKTNCPPSGHGSDTENAVYGQTVNPYDLKRSPGGSSGGEAALIAAGASPIGLGSDTSGGVRLPAHYCGVVALKPTSGRVPTTGIYNLPGGLTDPRTQIGPLARRVDDLLPLLRVITGPDYVDSGVEPMPLYDPAAVSARGLTISWFAYDPDSLATSAVADAVGASAQALARAGAQMVENRPLDLVGGARDLNRGWREMAGRRGQDIVELYHVWDQYRTNMLQYLRHYDAILCPVNHHPAPPVGERDPQRFDYTVPFNLTGYPAAVVPVRTGDGGPPIGVQLVSHPWREDIVLALAKILEDEFGGWQAPGLLATL